jgi:hypothetical protein
VEWQRRIGQWVRSVKQRRGGGGAEEKKIGYGGDGADLGVAMVR